MANYDNPNGFKPVSKSRVNPYTVKAATTVTRGDLVTIESGVILPYSAASHDGALGVAAESGTGGDSILVYDDPETIFVGQCSGNYVAATYDGTLVGVEGSTGAMEVDEDADARVLVVLRHYPLPGSTETGANARVAFQIAAHALGAVPSLDALLANDAVADAGPKNISDPAALTSPAAGAGAGADATTFSGAQCDALRADVAAVRDEVVNANSDISALVTKVNSILSTLRSAGILAA